MSGVSDDFSPAAPLTAAIEIRRVLRLGTRLKVRLGSGEDHAGVPYELILVDADSAILFFERAGRPSLAVSLDDLADAVFKALPPEEGGMGGAL